MKILPLNNNSHQWTYASIGGVTRVTINSDVCATAKGYERLAEAALRKRGGVA